MSDRRRALAAAMDKADDKWQHGIGSGGYDMSDPLGYWLMLADAAIRFELSDERPVDLGAVIDRLEQEIDDVGEVGIWGDYGPPAAPTGYAIGLLLENADAIASQAGEYMDGAES